MAPSRPSLMAACPSAFQGALRPSPGDVGDSRDTSALVAPDAFQIDAHVSTIADRIAWPTG